MVVVPDPAEVAIADAWWEQLDDERRISICRWVSQKKNFSAEEIPGQMILISGGEDHGTYDRAV